MAIEIVDGFDLRQRGPLDKRTVFHSVEQALQSLPAVQRYVGLTVYIEQEKKSYRFIDGVRDVDFVPAREDSANPAGYFHKIFEASDFNENSSVLSIPASEHGLGNIVYFGHVQKWIEDHFEDMFVNFACDLDGNIEIDCGVPMRCRVLLLSPLPKSIPENQSSGNEEDNRE